MALLRSQQYRRLLILVVVLLALAIATLARAQSVDQCTWVTSRFRAAVAYAPEHARRYALGVLMSCPAKNDAVVAEAHEWLNQQPQPTPARDR